MKRRSQVESLTDDLKLIERSTCTENDSKQAHAGKCVWFWVQLKEWWAVHELMRLGFRADAGSVSALFTRTTTAEPSSEFHGFSVQAISQLVLTVAPPYTPHF